MSNLYIWFETAEERYQWVMDHIPEARLGTNIPVPKSHIAKLKVEWVERVFNQNQPIKMKLLLELYEALKYAKVERPRLFSGDRVY